MTLRLALALKARVHPTNMEIMGIDGRRINVVGETTIRVKCDCSEHCNNPEVIRRCIVFQDLNVDMIISLEIALALELITLTCSDTKKEDKPLQTDDINHEIQALFRAIEELEDTTTEDRFMQEWDSSDSINQTAERADGEQPMSKNDSLETAAEQPGIIVMHSSEED